MDAVRYKATSSYPSTMLWKGFDRSALQADPSLGFWMFDDFDQIGGLAAPAADQIGALGPYNVHIDGGATGNAALVQTGFVVGTAQNNNALGVLSIDSAGTAVDNEAVVIQASKPLVLDGSTKLAAFEARVRFTNVTDTIVESFIGLLEAGLQTTTIIPITATADTMVDDKAWIAFNKLESNGDSVDFKFQENGTTSPVTAISGAAALTASTWVKLGFRFDSGVDGTRRITVFVDGTPLTTYVTAATVTGATFPNSTGLVPTFATKARSTTDYGIASIDWWCYGQVF